MDTLKPWALWLVTLDMRLEDAGMEVWYQATRTVPGSDPDDVTERAIWFETARQLGTQSAGGMGHKVLGVSRVRRVMGRVS